MPSHLIWFTNVCVLQFYCIFKQISHFLNWPISVVYCQSYLWADTLGRSVIAFWPTHCCVKLHLAESIGHLLDQLIFAAFNMIFFSLRLTHCADFIVWVSLYAFYLNPSCRFYHRIAMRDCNMQTALLCGLHHCADYIVMRIILCRLHCF